MGIAGVLASQRHQPYWLYLVTGKAVEHSNYWICVPSILRKKRLKVKKKNKNKLHAKNDENHPSILGKVSISID